MTGYNSLLKSEYKSKKQGAFLSSSVRCVIMLIIFVPFLFPTGLQYSSSFRIVYSLLYYWRIFSAVVCLGFGVLSFARQKLTNAELLFSMSTLWILICTVIKDGSISSLFTSWGGFLCFFFGASYFIRNDKILFINTLRKWLMFVAIINVITMIIYPNGLPLDNLVIINSDSRYVWFWSFKNHLCNLLLPLLATCVYYDFLRKLNKHSVYTLVAMLISLLTASLSKSGTTMLVMLLAIVLLICSNIKTLNRNFGVRFFSLLGIGLALGIVFFRIQNLFPFIIEDVLGKDLTLTSRTDLWNYAMNDISTSPIFGFGVQTSSTFGLLRYSNSYSHAHNAILTLAYQSGIVGVLLYGSFFMYVTFFKNKIVKMNRINYLLGVLIFAQLLFHITGSIGSCGLFLIMLIILDINGRNKNFVSFESSWR